MDKGQTMRGISGLIIIIVVLYFSGAGSWLWNNVKGLDSGCYTALERLGGTMASPICGALAHGIAVLDSTITSIGDKLDSWKQSTFGDTPGLSTMTSSIGERLSQLASSNEMLTQMMRAGPGSSGNSARQSIQQAIDSFTIGQGYLNQGGSSEALAWFQQGAQQPQGYGVMSQLQLGNLYMTGQGVPQNNQMASSYLEQANHSISTLMSSNTPQSRQLLSALPAAPEQVKAQLETAIHQLQSRK